MKCPLFTEFHSLLLLLLLLLLFTLQGTGKEIDGRPIRIDFSQPKTGGPGGPGGKSGGGSFGGSSSFGSDGSSGFGSSSSSGFGSAPSKGELFILFYYIYLPFPDI